MSRFHRWGTNQKRFVVPAGCLHPVAYHKLHCVDVTGNDRWPPCFELREHLLAHAFGQRPLVGARQMDQPEIHRVPCANQCGAQRLAVCLSDETSYDLRVCEMDIGIRIAQEHVRVATCITMDNEPRIRHLIPNACEQLCGLKLWQAELRVANFDEAEHVDAGLFKRLFDTKSYGDESALLQASAIQL